VDKNRKEYEVQSTYNWRPAIHPNMFMKDGENLYGPVGCNAVW